MTLRNKILKLLGEGYFHQLARPDLRDVIFTAQKEDSKKYAKMARIMTKMYKFSLNKK